MLPVVEAVQRLEARQRETRALVEQLALKEPPATLGPVQAELQHRELVSLLMELLQETQEPPELDLARRLGLPTGLTSSPGSVS